jgi:ribose transport system permease protein
MRTAISRVARAPISGVYVFAVFIVIFSLWLPDTFPTTTNWKNIASSQAVTAIVSLGLLLPLAAGVFDLSIGATLGTASVLSAWMMKHGVDPALAIFLTLGAGILIGSINGTLVAVFKIDSFIATLGMSSVLTAVILGVSNSRQIIGLPDGFQNLTSAQPLGIPIQVYYLAVIAIFLWYLLEHTPFGRYLFAIGGAREAARLAGVRTNAYVFLSLVGCSTVAALAGLIVTANIGAASPDLGPSYLLPAFAAAFLGATQFKSGRFNVPGTLLATYLLATGVTGLQLAGASEWVTSLFNGLALIIAVGLAGFAGRLKVWRRRPPGEDAPSGDPNPELVGADR